MSRSTGEVVYTPDAELRHPIRLLRSMFRDLVSSRELVWRLMKRDISAQYRQTALGYFWAIFPPLLTSFVFILLRSANVVSVADTGVPYPVYVVTGTVFFTVFMDAVAAPLKIITTSKTLLAKVNFPREALLLASLGPVLLSLTIKLALIAVTMLVYGMPVTGKLPLFIVPCLGLLMIGLMVGTFLVPLGALFLDVGQAVQIAGGALVLLTPAVYPAPRSGALATISAWNPLTPLIESARGYLLHGASDQFGAALAIMGVTAMLLFAGWVLFRIALPSLVERFGG